MGQTLILTGVAGQVATDPESAAVAVPQSVAELLFQVISGRAEQAAIIVTTNTLCGAPRSTCRPS